MTKPDFTNDGIIIQTFEEAFEELAEGLRQIYGYDINLDQNSPDGQRVGILTKLSLDLQSYGVFLYNSFDPDLAEGLSLDKICKLAGIQRDPPKKSTWVIEIKVSSDTTLSNNYTVRDNLNQTWVISSEIELLEANNPTAVLFESSNFGKIVGQAFSEIEQVTFNQEVFEIVAPSNATIGENEETDPQLRKRRTLSFSNPSLGTRAGLQARILNLNDVIDAIVYENTADTTDPILNIPSHSLWVIVDGSTDQVLADLIIRNKSGGTGLKGSVVVTSDTGDEVRFDRPVDQPLYVIVDAIRKQFDLPLDIQLIKEQIASKIYTIGENAIASELYGFGQKAGESFFLSVLAVSDDGLIYTNTRVEPNIGGRFVLDVDNITVNEII